MDQETEMGLKNALLKKLIKSGGKPYSETALVSNSNYGHFVITRMDRGYHLEWSLSDEYGDVIDTLVDDYDSYAAMWDILRELLELENRDE